MFFTNHSIFRLSIPSPSLRANKSLRSGPTRDGKIEFPSALFRPRAREGIDYSHGGRGCVGLDFIA